MEAEEVVAEFNKDNNPPFLLFDCCSYSFVVVGVGVMYCCSIISFDTGGSSALGQYTQQLLLLLYPSN